MLAKYYFPLTNFLFFYVTKYWKKKKTEHELYFESPVRSCVTHCIYNITLYYYFKILV